MYLIIAHLRSNNTKNNVYHIFYMINLINKTNVTNRSLCNIISELDSAFPSRTLFFSGCKLTSNIKLVRKDRWRNVRIPQGNSSA